MKARRAQGDISDGVSPATLRKIRLGISPAQDVSPPPADEAARERRRQRRLENLQRARSSRSEARRTLLPALNEAGEGESGACSSTINTAELEDLLAGDQ